MHSADRRKAAKLYLAASKLFVDRRFEEAMHSFEQAASLDPENSNYTRAIEVARGYAVTALIQTAAKNRILGDESGARAALVHALQLDPKSIAASQHMDELADDQIALVTPPLYELKKGDAEEAPSLTPAGGRHSFHLRTDQHQVILEVFKAYGLTATLDSSVHPANLRFDLDDANFGEAMRALELATKTFYTPVDGQRVLVLADTRENRKNYQRMDEETVYLSGLTEVEMTEVESLAKNVFAIPQAKTDPSAHAIILRGPATALHAFNLTMDSLLNGRSQVMLDVRILQLAHTGARKTGLTIPQSMTAFNLYAEEESILSQNSALVQEIISSGLASANDRLAILAILVASGEVSSSLLSSGFAVFGGGITESALELGTPTFKLNTSSSDTRTLDRIQLRLQDGEDGTIKEGERYPIQTSSYSSLASSSASAIAGLSSSGNSSALSSLLAEYSSATKVPMVQYEDLGLTLKTRPNVMRNGDVALNVDFKMDSLSGSSLDGDPILNNRSYSSVVMIKEGETAVVSAEMDVTESRDLSGTPGLSEVPGMNNLSDKETEKDYATLVIVITPHVVRGPQAAGHTAMMRIEKTESTQ
jgi:hypothetical protein